MSRPLHDLFRPVDHEQLRRQLRLDPEHMRRFRNARFKAFCSDAAAQQRFPALAQRLEPSLKLESQHNSRQDGASKLLFRTHAGLAVETVVLRIASGRTTLCVSSQVGCAAACRFCATGTMGIARSLSSSEILDQVRQAGQLLAGECRTPRNIVFMGMGEPFHNEDAIVQAVERLTDPAWFNFSPHKVLVSSVGVTDGMLRFAARFPSVGLALSLHSACDHKRAQIIPLAKRYPLAELRRALHEINTRQNRPVMLEYLMLDGFNDAHEDAQDLLEWTQGLNVHINLIPYNEVPGIALRGTPRAACVAFADTLKQAGRTTTLRHSLGRDIDAACGQLVKRRGGLSRAPRLASKPYPAG